MLKSLNQTLITGCYRSGTEYITQLLNNHPNLASTMYTTNFMRYYYNRYDPIQQNYKQLIKDAKETIKKRWKKTLNTEQLIEYLKTQKEITYGLIYDAMMSDLFLKKSKTRWAEKTQLVWREIPDFLTMFPTGKAILIIRDPRSVLASFKKYTYAPEPLYLGAIFNCYDSMKYSLEYKKRYSDRFLQIKYEDILTNPEFTIKSIFTFLNLSTNHDLFSQKNWKDARGEPWKDNTAFGKFDKELAIQRWKENLKEWEISMCEEINQPYMEFNGYQLSGRKVNWNYSENEDISRYLDNWTKGNGIQEFPTDPLKPANWEENR